jgi:hypothetical protein
MTRLLDLVFLAVLVWMGLEMAVRFLRELVGGARPSSTTASRTPPPSPSPAGPQAIQELVRCSHCGVYVPRSGIAPAGAGELVCSSCRASGRARTS